MAPNDDVPAAHPPEAHGDEHKVEGGPAVLAANAAVLALTRAARSFTLYDSANKVVRQLIGDYRDKLRQFLDTHGALVLEVHPFELLLGRDLVYVEKDRERSLAFRLFRDGVRRITFTPEVTWEETLHLLEILSIRFIGVRQQEDDLVTLLRKAGFAGITVSAIEGFVPEEEVTETPLEPAARGAAAAHVDPPRQWDLPLPPFPEAAPLRYRPVAPGALEALRAEEAPEALPLQALRAVEEVLGEAATDAERELALAFAAQVREFLIVEGRADVLARLAAIVAQPGFVDAKALRALVLAQPPSTTEVPPALAAMLDSTGGDCLALTLDLLTAEGDGPRAPFLRRLAARAAHGSIEPLRARLGTSDGATAGAILVAASEIDPKAALTLALERAVGQEPAVELAALSLIEALPPEPAHLSAVRHLLHAQTEAVRTRALGLLALRAGARALPLLRAHVEGRADGVTAAEAEATGRAMAEIAAHPALDAFSAWLRPKSTGLLGRIVGAVVPVAEQHAALAGLERIGGEEAEALLADLAENGDASVRARAADLLAARRRAAAGASGGGHHG